MATVVEPMRGGYAVEITTMFRNARGQRALETRCLYFGWRELKWAGDGPAAIKPRRSINTHKRS